MGKDEHFLLRLRTKQQSLFSTLKYEFPLNINQYKKNRKIDKRYIDLFYWGDIIAYKVNPKEFLKLY